MYVLPMMSGAATIDQMAICVRSSAAEMQPLPMSSMSCPGAGSQRNVGKRLGGCQG
jgi:hypothetical protein